MPLIAPWIHKKQRKKQNKNVKMLALPGKKANATKINQITKKLLARAKVKAPVAKAVPVTVKVVVAKVLVMVKELAVKVAKAKAS